MKGILRIEKTAAEAFGWDELLKRKIVPRRQALFLLGRFFIPSFCIRDLADAIDANDKAKMQEILDLMQTIVNFGLNSSHCPPHYTEVAIFVRRMRAMLLGEPVFDINPNSPHADLMDRLAGNLGQRRWRDVENMDEVAFPGDRIPKSSVNVGPYDPADDVMFVTDNPDTDWIAELISNDHEAVVELHEYHKTDEEKTQERQDEYEAAGYGPGMRPKVIFSPRGEYYVCLGLAYLVPGSFYPHPKIRWVFPQMIRK